MAQYLAHSVGSPRVTGRRVASKASAMSTLETIAVNTIDGAASSLGAFAGQVRLVVNVASKCGLTPQYEALEALYKKFHERGFEVLAFPANEFGAQEPGTEAEIKDFCSVNYNVTFPMFAKIIVKGAGQHPLYAALTAAQPQATANAGSGFRAKLESYGIKLGAPEEIMWNFEKFLVGRDGTVLARFAPDVAPSDLMIVEAIEKALG